MVKCNLKFKLSVNYYLDFKLIYLQILVYTYQHIKAVLLC